MTFKSGSVYNVLNVRWQGVPHSQTCNCKPRLPKVVQRARIPSPPSFQHLNTWKLVDEERMMFSEGCLATHKFCMNRCSGSRSSQLAQSHLEDQCISSKTWKVLEYGFGLACENNHAVLNR